jgi:RHS repeat-associated protein
MEEFEVIFAGGSSLKETEMGSGVFSRMFADEKVSSLGTAGSMLWALTDHENSVRDLAAYDSGTDTTTIANHRIYDAYGNLTSETDSAVDCLFGYTGRQFDESTGLQNNLNRWYDPTTGRWLSQDPMSFAAGDANLYRYVGNNVTTLTDPLGLCSDDDDESTDKEAEQGRQEQADWAKYGPQTEPVRVVVTGYPGQELVVAINRLMEYMGMSDRVGGPVIGPALPGLGTPSSKPGWPGNNPAQSPPGSTWRGKPGSTPGSSQGNYYNPRTGESFRPDLDHPEPIGPHWDYRAPDGTWYRIMPDGTMVPK